MKTHFYHQSRFICICLLLPVFVINEAVTGEVSNIKLIDSLLVDILSEKFTLLKGNQTDTLVIDVQKIEGDKGGYFKLVCGNQALKNSFHVYRNYNPSASFDGMVIDLDRFSINVTYSKPFTKKLFGPNYTVRRVEIILRGQLYRKLSGKVLESLDELRSYEDEIRYDDIQMLEKSNYTFTNGVRKDYSFWDKLIEPALTITSVALLVYLFFSQRT